MSYKNNGYFVKKLLVTGLCTGMIITGCSTTGARDAAQASQNSGQTQEESSSESADSSKESSSEKEMFTKRDLKNTYKASEAVKVKLKDDSSKAGDSSVEIDGNTVTITKEGVYVFSGTLSDGQIVVDTGDDKAKVQIVLNGVNITNDSSACIYAKSADKVFVTTAKGSKNTLTVSGDYEKTDDSKIDAAVFAKTDLTVNGQGSLSIDAKYGHGIVSKDDLKVTGGTIKVSSAKKGLSGKDSVRIADGKLTVNAGTEGVEGTFIYIEDGTIDVTAADDGLNAANSENNNDGMRSDDSTYITIKGGTVNINAGGDGIDSNGTFTVSGGTTTVSGPTNDGNGALDAAGGSVITGGTVIAAGSSGMAENFGSDSTQGSILVTLETEQTGAVTLSDSDGKEILSWTPEKQYSSVVVSTKEITKDGTYTLKAGSETQKIEMDGLIYGEGNHMGPGGGKGDFGGQGKPDFENGNRMAPPDGSDGKDGHGGKGGHGGKQHFNKDDQNSGSEDNTSSDSESSTL